MTLNRGRQLKFLDKILRFWTSVSLSRVIWLLTQITNFCKTHENLTVYIIVLEAKAESKSAKVVYSCTLRALRAELILTEFCIST